MMAATVLEASARMAEVSTPSRFTFVDTFRHGIFLAASSSLSLGADELQRRPRLTLMSDEEEKKP
jgi:hypothetical protein